MRKQSFGLLLLLAAACASPPKEDLAVAVSLTGVKFYEPVRTPPQQARLDSALNIAKANFDKDPSEENYIWYGRREGYLMHLDKAIGIYTEGLDKYPGSYKLLRHRGHRFISSRKFDEAITDFKKAAELMEGVAPEIEPDGQPNKLGIPLSTTQFNVWYHLALAYYLNADFANAEAAWLECYKTCDNDDSKVAVLDWLYMTYRREGKEAEAAKLLDEVTENMNIIENDSYYTRLKMYKGWLKPEDVLVVDPSAEDYDLSMATQGYGVGNYYLYNGDSTKAKATFEKVVAGKLFAAFGFIAAEAALARK